MPILLNVLTSNVIAHADFLPPSTFWLKTFLSALAVSVADSDPDSEAVDAIVSSEMTDDVFLVVVVLVDGIFYFLLANIFVGCSSAIA